MIVKASLSDYKCIKIFRSILADQHHEYNPNVWKKKSLKFWEYMFTFLKHDIFICKEGACKGFIQVTPLTNGSEHTIHIDYLYTHKPFRYNGVATELLNYCASHYKDKYGKVKFSVDASPKNEEAINFYKSHGFNLVTNHYVM